jgi:hypothetical protein
MHPTLQALIVRWKQQPMKQEYLDFLLHIAVYYQDRGLLRWSLEHGANINAPPMKWYARFLNNFRASE